MRRFTLRAVPAQAAAEQPNRRSTIAVVTIAAALMLLAGAATLTPAANAQSEAPASEASASDDSSTTADSSAKKSEPARITSVKSLRPPKRRVVRKRFTPPAAPGPRRVRRIIRIEARRWNISPSRLSRRVGCESTYRWYAGNGAYQGLLQFASSTFYRGIRTIRSRKVHFKRKRRRMVRATRLVRYSNGTVKRKPGIKRWQTLVTIYRGTLPRNPPVTHAWAQLRIGAQAIRGISAVSTYEWSCPA